MVKLASVFASSLGMAFLAVAGHRIEASEQAPKPDSPEVQQLLEAAKKSAGTEWAEAFDFICALNAGRANSPTDPVIEPTKVFDNLYVIGRTSTAVWAVTTSAGIVLIDAGYGDQLESVLLPGMKTLGLDPGQVKYVIVGHGHGDHFGGAAYFQQRGALIASQNSSPQFSQLCIMLAHGRDRRMRTALAPGH